MDTSPKTQVAQILVQYGRPSRLLERNLYGHTLAGLLWERQFEKVLLKHGWEKVPNWECICCQPCKRTILISVCGLQKLAGKKQNINPMWKVLMKQVELGEPTSCLDHVYLCCTQRECKMSRISAGVTEKLPSSGETWCAHLFLALRYGRSCKEMCGAVLRAGQQNNSAILWSFNSMPWWPPIQWRRAEICGRIVKRMLSSWNVFIWHALAEQTFDGQ